MSEEESKDIISLKIAGIDYQLYCPEEEPVSYTHLTLPTTD